MRLVDLGTFTKIGVQQALNSLVRLVSLVEFRSKVSSDDTSPNYLESKFVGDTGVTLTVLNPGGDERIQVSTAATAHTSGTITNPGVDTYLLPDGSEESGADAANTPAQGVLVLRAGSVGRLFAHVDTAPPNTDVLVKLWRFPAGNAPGSVVLTTTIEAGSKSGQNLATAPVAAGDVLVVSHNNTDAQTGNLSAAWEVPS
jgi:hypothetical protein